MLQVALGASPVGFWHWEARPQQWPTISTSATISRITISLSPSDPITRLQRLPHCNSNDVIIHQLWPFDNGAIPQWSPTGSQSSSNHVFLWPAILDGNPSTLHNLWKNQSPAGPPMSPFCGFVISGRPPVPDTPGGFYKYSYQSSSKINPIFHDKPSSNKRIPPFFGEAPTWKNPEASLLLVIARLHLPTILIGRGLGSPEVLLESLGNRDNAVYNTMYIWYYMYCILYIVYFKAREEAVRLQNDSRVVLFTRRWSRAQHSTWRRWAKDRKSVACHSTQCSMRDKATKPKNI